MNLDAWLARINRRYGGVGSVIATVFWLLMLGYAVVTILSEFF